MGRWNDLQRWGNPLTIAILDNARFGAQFYRESDDRNLHTLHDDLALPGDIHRVSTRQLQSHQLDNYLRSIPLQLVLLLELHIAPILHHRDHLASLRNRFQVPELIHLGVRLDYSVHFVRISGGRPTVLLYCTTQNSSSCQGRHRDEKAGWQEACLPRDD